MNLIIERENFDNNNIFFGDPIKNTVMTNSSFIRIFYSEDLFILNGIYVKITVNNINFKNKFMEDSSNKNTIFFIQNLEKTVLRLYKPTKFHSYKIEEQFVYLISKYYNSSINKCNFYLKISGIWETDSHIGLTYKFIHINQIQDREIIENTINLSPTDNPMEFNL